MRYFLYISWFAQLMVGIGLFTISFLILYAVLLPFFNSAIVTFALAMMLQIAKVNAVIWHRYFSNHYNNAYPDSIRWVSYAFKTGILGMSILGSIGYLSHQLASFNHEIMLNCIQMAKAIFGRQLLSYQLIFSFSVLISLLIELGILLSFETVTVSMLALMQKQQEYELNKQVLKEQMRSQQDANTILHDADMDSIKKASERTIGKAKLNREVTL